jgi:NAD(P)-dependent dehydrogenase (short-subunit alcohol dehydrogenase family)
MGSIGVTTSPGDLAHRMSKAALSMTSKLSVTELHDDHTISIAISIVVHPGWVRTTMGGPNAPTLASESAQGILKQIHAASFADSGEFLDFQGSRRSW